VTGYEKDYSYRITICAFSLSEDVISLCATLSQAGEDRLWATPDLRGARLNKALSCPKHRQPVHSADDLCVWQSAALSLFPSLRSQCRRAIYVITDPLSGMTFLQRSEPA
jgi:hypothetical protein